MFWRREVSAPPPIDISFAVGKVGANRRGRAVIERNSRRERFFRTLRWYFSEGDEKKDLKPNFRDSREIFSSDEEVEDDDESCELDKARDRVRAYGSCVGVS